MALEAYTDGASSPNGNGGWAWAVDGGLSASGAVMRTTNQRMEMQAALEAIRSLARPGLTIVTDSAYVSNCFLQEWWSSWMGRGWRTVAGKPVKNQDIWEPLIDEAIGYGVQWRHIRGHSGDRMNDLVDRMAVAAKKSLT